MAETNRARANWLGLAVGLGFLTLGCLGAVGSWGAYWQDSEIERSGPRAAGHVTRKSKLASADGDSDFLVDYWFQLPNGQRVEAHRGVPRELWDRLREGDETTVAYSAANPNRNFPLGGGVTAVGVTIFVSVLAGVFAVFGGLLVVGFFTPARAEPGDGGGP